METLRRLLREAGRDDGQAEAIASRYGYNPNELTDADAALIAQEELQSAALVASNGNGKAATTKKPQGKRRKKTPDLTEALTHTAAIAQSELSSVTEIVQAGAKAWANDQADQMISTVRNAPREALEKFGQLALDEAADLDSFRQIGKQISATVFSLQQPTEAE